MHTDDGGATWKQSDGTAYTLPVADANGEQVFDSGTDLARIVGMGIDSTGKGRFIVGYKFDPNHEQRFVYHNGSAWTSAQMTNAVTQFWGTSYVSGGDVNPADEDEAILSVEVSGRFEMQLWKTADSGATWSLANNITTNSSADNYRPIYVQNGHSELPYFWLQGAYTGDDITGGDWTGYDDTLVLCPLTKDTPSRD